LMSVLDCTVTERAGTVRPVMFCGRVLREAGRLCFVRLWMDPTTHPSPLYLPPPTTKFNWFVCQASHPSAYYSSPDHKFYFPLRVSFCTDLGLDLLVRGGVLNLADVQLGRALRSLAVSSPTMADYSDRARSKTWSVFARLNTGIIGSILTQGMGVCVLLFFVCVVLCMVAVLRRADPPSKESYRLF
jgi:hypothetical protein